MSNYAVVINNVIESFIHMTPYTYENTDANLKNQLIEMTPNRGTLVIGGTYDSNNDIFVPPAPYPSWTFDKNTMEWIAPTPRPDVDGSQQFSWSEAAQKWVGNGNPVKMINK